MIMILIIFNNNIIQGDNSSFATGTRLDTLPPSARTLAVTPLVKTISPY